MKPFNYFQNKIAFVILCTIFIPSVSFAIESANSVKQKINDTSSQIEALDKQIKIYQDQISQTTEDRQTLANLIRELVLTRAKLETETKKTEKKISATGIVINTLATGIKEKSTNIESSKETVSRLLYGLYQREHISILQTILIKNNLREASQEYNNAIAVNEKVRENILALISVRNQLNNTKSQKEVEQKNLSNLRKNLNNQKQAVEITKQEKDKLLVETKNKESNFQKLLADQQKKRDAFEKDLRDYEAQLKFILNQNLLPGAGTSPLTWPLDNVFITQLFGRTVSAQRLYVSGSHSGVDFRASIGTPVHAMATGVVLGTGNTDEYCQGASFGKWIFIKYNNGLSSTFGHLSVIQTEVGQRVTLGDTVGLSGNSGHSTGPHLHVTVYASQGAEVRTLPSRSCNGRTFTMPIAPTSAYLDPLLYLPKTNTTMQKTDNPRD